MDDEEAATKALAAWKAEMPPTPSAYKPSGRVPLSPLLLMVLSVPPASVLGAGAEVVVGGIVTLHVWLAVFFNAVLAFCGFIWYFLVFVLLIVALIAIVAPFVAGGVAAWITVPLGQWGKNRSPAAAALLSALSAILSVVLLGWLFQTFVQEPLDARQPFGASPETLHIFSLILAILGGLIAPITAVIVARDMVNEAKFCEESGHFLQGKTVKKVRLGSLRALTQHLTMEDADGACRALHAPAGNDGEVSCRCLARWVRLQKRRRELPVSISIPRQRGGTRG